MTALIFPVPEADATLERWRLRYTKEGPRGMPAHITVLYPFAPTESLDQSVSDSLERVIGAHPAFRFTLSTIERWLDGVLVLTGEPREPFRALIADVCAAFPAYQPYEGQFTPDEVIPHCTIAVASTYPSGISEADANVFSAAEEDVRASLPIESSASAVWLMDDTSGRWTKHRTFSLSATSL